MRKTVKVLSSMILCILIAVLSLAVVGCVAPPDDEVPSPTPQDVYYKITDTSPNKHGQLSWTADEMKGTDVKEGSTVDFTVAVKQGYEIIGVMVNKTNVTETLDGNSFTVENVSSNLSVSVYYAVIKYNISVNKPENGSITPKGTGEWGTNVTLTMIPKIGYRIKELTVNDKNVTASVINNQYTFKIYEDADIKCEYEQIPLTVTASSSANGSVILSADSFVYGDEVTVTVSPKPGYRPTVLTVNGVPKTITDGKYVFIATEDTQIICGFTAIRYTVTALDCENGYIRIDNANPSQFEPITVTFVPSSGYEVVSATVDGQPLAITDNTAVISNITSDIKVHATFDFTAVKFTGYAEYEDGVRAKGINVRVGDDVLVTDNDGKYTYTAPRNTYIFKADTDTHYSNPVSITPDKPFATVETLIVRERTVGVSSESALSVVDIVYDEQSKSEKITTTIKFNGTPLYLNGMLAEDGVVFFSVKNITDTSIEKYETDPGIGIYLKNATTSNTLYTHIVGNKSRYLLNGSWSNVPYGSASEYYNIHNIGEKYYFAFVKQGATVSYYVLCEDGTYRLSGSYSNTLISGECYFAFIASTNASAFTHSTVEISDISYSVNTEDVLGIVEAQIEANIDGGSISYDADLAKLGKTITFRLTPDEGKYLKSLSVNNIDCEATYTAWNDYTLSYLIKDTTVCVKAVFETGENNGIKFSDGTMGEHNYDTSLYYRNDQDLSGADPGAIYVSVEDDPVYGGWFYMAVTGFEGHNTTKTYGAYPIYRSKNLIDWEQCGTNGGYALAVDPTKDWSMGHYWAPELLQETIEVDGVKKNRYYIYFSAQSKVGNANTEYTSKTGTDWDRLYIGIGVSDCPYGPYTMVDTNNYYQFYGDNTTKVNKNGNAVTRNTPAFNFYRYNPEIAAAYKSAGKNADFWPAIDISPFVDPATGDMYCYFSQHVSSVSSGNVIWVVKMKDYITPDYSTMHVVSIPGYSVKALDFKTYVNSGINYGTNASTKDKVTRYAFDGNVNGGGVNEGAFTIAHYDEVNKQWLYYLTYSPYGYGNRGYSICQAVSTSPFGPFTKLDPNKGFTVVGIVNMNSAGSGNGNIDYTMSKDYSASIDYMAGTGHHSFVKAGDEIFAVYHSFPNPINNYNQNGSFMGRCISVDRVKIITSPSITYGDLDSASGTTPLPVLYGNGPTYSVQPLPEVVSGYENITDEAIISYTNPNATGMQYLKDGLYVTHTVYKDWEYQTEGEDVISLTFPTARSIRSVMVYNSAQYNYALKKLSSLTLTLADGKIITFNNLTQNVDNCNTLKKVMRYGGSIVADFEEVKVKKIEIAVNGKDKYNTANNVIRIGDIVVLGRADGKEKKDFEFRSANDTESNYIVDGIANDKEWKDKNWYLFDNGEFFAKATAIPGEDGVYVTATVYDKYLFHMGGGGHDPKFEGMGRWYKNTYLNMGVLVNNGTKTSSLRSVNISPYQVKSSYPITASMSFSGAINTVTDHSFTVEAFFPYSMYGITKTDKAYLTLTYYRPLSSNEVSPAYYNICNSDITDTDTLVGFNGNGYVSPYTSAFGTNGTSGVKGEWKTEKTTKATSVGNERSVIFLNGKNDSLLQLTSTVTATAKANSYAGYVLKNRSIEKAYLLDTSYMNKGKLSRIVLYSMENGIKSKIYDDNGAFGDSYTNTTSFKLVKNASMLCIFVNGKFVYAERSISGNVEVGLYSEGAVTEFAGIDYNTDKNKINTATKDIYYITTYSHYGIDPNVSFIYTDKLYMAVSPIVTADKLTVKAVTVNGEDKTSLMENGKLVMEYTDNKDAVVTVSANTVATVYKVTGSLTKDGNLASDVTLRFVGESGYVRELKANLSYTVNLPADKYTVYVFGNGLGCETYTLSVSAATTFDVSIIGKTIGGKATVNGNTYSSNTSGYYINNAGTIASCKDVGALGTVMFTGVSSDCAVIRFTSECFLNPADLPAGAKYEQDATVSVYFGNGTVASSVGYHGTSARVRTDVNGSWATCTKQPVSNVLPKNLSEYGTEQSFLCIYLNNTWYMYFEKNGEFVFAYEYNFKEGESATGECVFGLTLATSYQYTRIRFKDVSIETDKTAVEATFAELGVK